MEFREVGKKALRSCITIEKNIIIIENNIFEKYKEEELYKTVIYDVVTYIKKGTKLQEVLKIIKDGNTGWNHQEFNDVKFKQQEQDDFIINPFQVEEGVLKCPKCSQFRTFSYSKQTRSADEPMTTFANCMNCKYKWTYSG